MRIWCIKIGIVLVLHLDAYMNDLRSVEEKYSETLHGDPNTALNNFHDDLTHAVDKHIPIKKRKILRKPAPFMNKGFKSAILKKRQLLISILRTNLMKSRKIFENKEIMSQI
jgi:hypothetical protein